MTKIQEYLAQVYFIRKVRAFIQPRNPFQKWLLFRNITSYLLRVCGIDIFDPFFKLTWLSICPAIVVFDVFTSIVYSAHFYRDDFAMALRGFTWVGLLATVCNIFSN